MTRTIGDDLVRSFQENGFVVVGDLLTTEELDRYRTAVVRAVGVRKSNDNRTLAEKSRYEQSFTQCINLWEDFEDVRPLTFHQRIGRTAADLLEADSVRIWHDQALFKEPGGRETDLHQDQPYWPIAEPRTVTAWIPFTGSSLRSGCMGYVRGSHRLGVRKFVDIFRADDAGIREQTREILSGEPVFVEVPRGSVAFHDGLVAHCAKPNTGEEVRAVHTVIYFADGCTRSAEPKAHMSVDRAGIAVGDVIRSDVTPIAWPRSDGDLPAPPPRPAGG